MSTISLSFVRTELDQKIKMSDITLAQQPILKHCAERRRNRHRELERHKIVDESLDHSQQRDVRFCNRLKQPLFLEEMLVLRMPNEREMRVENEGKMAGH